MTVFDGAIGHWITDLPSVTGQIKCSSALGMIQVSIDKNVPSLPVE